MAEQAGEINKDIADRGKAVVAGAREKVVDLLGSARDGTGNVQATLADRLEAGAEKMRNRPAIAIGSQRRAEQASRTIADGMDRSAMWLRENDLTDIGGLLRRELRERPGRVALIALGLGIIVGRASRRR
jgi:hypothetical protein